MNKIVKGDRFYEVLSKYKEAVTNLSLGFLTMGECLRDIKREQLWRLDGMGMITFRQWVEGELRISYSQAQRLIQVFEQAGKYLQKPEFRGIDIYKVVLVLPYFEGKTDAECEDLLYQAKELKVKDLQDVIRERKGEIAQADCDHINNTTWNRCNSCGKFWK